MTAFLLDTHAFIWLVENAPNLPIRLREVIERADTVYISVVSLWEIAIKINIGKLSLHKSYESIGIELKASDLVLLPISFAHTQQLCDLPLHHRDPFDRMLISQALTQSLILISKDTQFDAYPIQRLWE